MPGYPGSKAGSGTWQKIINLMPPHRTYIEAFLGSGQIMRHKRPAENNIGIELDPTVSAAFSVLQIPNVQVITGDAIRWLQMFECLPELGCDTLLYLDPPYLRRTRAGQRRKLYEYEMWAAGDHARLIEVITRLKCMVMISGYASPLYSERLATWRAISFEVITRSGQLATEWVWCNFAEPLELHDYRFLGEGFREREKIRRQQKRWRAKLEKMSSQQRYAMLGVLEQMKRVDIAAPFLARVAADIDAGAPTRDYSARAPSAEYGEAGASEAGQ